MGNIGIGIFFCLQFRGLSTVPMFYAVDLTGTIGKSYSSRT